MNEDRLDTIRTALVKWADANMSTAELFNRVGLVWDGAKQSSLYSRHMDEIDALKAQVAHVHEHGDDDICKACIHEAEVERLQTALGKISEGRGRFSRDNFEHCRNTVEDMKELAIKALAPKEENGERQGTL